MTNIVYRDVTVPAWISADWTGPLGEAFRAGVNAERSHVDEPDDE